MIQLARIVTLTLIAAMTAPAGALAADYPVRPVKWIVPYPPAGTTVCAQ